MNYWKLPVYPWIKRFQGYSVHGRDFFLGGGIDQGVYSHYTVHHYHWISILNRSYFLQFWTNLSEYSHARKFVDIFDSQEAIGHCGVEEDNIRTTPFSQKKSNFEIAALFHSPYR